MKHVVQYEMESKLTIYDQTRSIAHTYLSKRECGVKECAFHILSEQRLKETDSLVTFEISNISEKRFRICLSEDFDFESVCQKIKYLCYRIIQQTNLSGIG